MSHAFVHQDRVYTPDGRTDLTPADVAAHNQAIKVGAGRQDPATPGTSQRIP